MTDLDDLIARLRAATEGTTPEPWIASAEEVYAGPYGALIIADMIYPDTRGNAAFIAAARQLVPEAAAALEALRAENERLREALETIAEYDTGATAGLAYTASAALTPR